MITPSQNIFHLYNRAGFGISNKEVNVLVKKPIKEIVDDLFNNSAKNDPITIIGREEIFRYKEVMEKMSKKEFNQLVKEKERELNLTWVKRMVDAKDVLREKQTLFWHNHFACRVGNPFVMQELNNIHRKFAFEKFGTLLLEVSKSAAMLDFLNNQQNRKEHPNENFARELMELFTLGRGNYTENDIKESARAFTGWGFNRKNFEFEFREKQHDFGEKTFFSRKGNYDGKDIIQMILENKQTAIFICRKLYKFYVNEVVDEDRVKSIADYYYSNQYDTGLLLRKIFTSDWFYAEENIGCNIKSPVQFLVGLTRLFNVKYEDDKVWIGFQRALGQQLFFPPNVAGWPGGQNWIDSSSLMIRMRLPSVLLNNGEIETSDKIDDPDDMLMNAEAGQKNKRFNTVMNWTSILDEYKDLSLDKMSLILLARQPNQKVIDLIVSEAANDKKEQILKLISLPEFSLC